MEYEQICSSVRALSIETSKFLKDSKARFSTDQIEVKSENNFVTWVDKASENLLVEGLLKILPGSAFIAEENTIPHEKSEFTWIIDPLDGTTNFIHGIPLYCISIALMRESEIVLGVIHEINLNEVFYAWKDGGAWLNGCPIRVSKTLQLKETLLATGFPYYDYSRLDSYMELFRYCLQNTHGLRRLGSAAADMAYVACGRFDGFFEYGLKSWDVAAGILIVHEAGGVTTDFEGGDNYLFGQEIVTANANIINDLVTTIQRFFKNDNGLK